jgi:hypothetical protein
MNLRLGAVLAVWLLLLEAPMLPSLLVVELVLLVLEAPMLPSLLVVEVLLVLVLETPMHLSLLVVEVLPLPLERHYCWPNHCSRSNMV